MTDPDDHQAPDERDDFDVRLKARLALWETLPGPEKEAIRARFDRLNPMPSRMHAGLWELTRRSACLDLMETNRPVILETGPTAPISAPAPVAKPADPTPSLTEGERRAFLDGLSPWERARFEACSPARLDQVILEFRLGLLTGERFGRKPAIPEVEPELAGSAS